MKNKSTLTLCTFLFVFCMSILYTNKTFAQEHGIYELVKNKVSKKSSKQVKPHKERSEFYNVAQKPHTTFYFENNKFKKKYGEGAPIRIALKDMSSFNLLNQKNSKYDKVKLITITLKSKSDLNYPLDLSNTKEFSRLQYIYIKCLFDCNAKQIEKFVKAPDDKVRIFYTSARPS